MHRHLHRFCFGYLGCDYYARLSRSSFTIVLAIYPQQAPHIQPSQLLLHPLHPQAKEAKKNSGLLLVASARGFAEDAKALLEMGAVLEFRDKQGRRAVHFAAAHGKLEVVQYLWSKGAEMDAEDLCERPACATLTLSDA